MFEGVSVFGDIAPGATPPPWRRRLAGSSAAIAGALLAAPGCYELLARPVAVPDSPERIPDVIFQVYCAGMNTIDPEKERRRLAAEYARMADGELEKLAEEALSLTDIAKEILKRELARRKLQPDLREPEVAKEPPPPPPELVTVRKYRDLQEALLAKGLLDSAGIECWLGDENIVRLDWFLSNFVGGVKLWVREEDAAEAANLLDQSRPESFAVEGVGEYTQPHCPNCDSMEVTFNGLNRRASYGSLLVGIPIPLKHAGWKCNACGHEWEDSDTRES